MMEMNTRVTVCTGLKRERRRAATTRPSGSENRSVRKKMAQVRPRPSLIFWIIVAMVMSAFPFAWRKGYRFRHNPSAGFFNYTFI